MSGKDVHVVDELEFKVASLNVEFLLGGHSLCLLHVGTGDSFDLEVL